MAFKIHRENVDTGEIVIAAPEFTTGEEALRAAMGNADTYIFNHWDLGIGGNVDGPADNKRFKTYIDRSPGRAVVQLQYDYKPTPTTDATNRIIWEVVQI